MAAGALHFKGVGTLLKLTATRCSAANGRSEVETNAPSAEAAGPNRHNLLCQVTPVEFRPGCLRLRSFACFGNVALCGVLLNGISYCIVHIANLVTKGRSFGLSFARPVVFDSWVCGPCQDRGGGPLEAWGAWGPYGLRFKLAG